MTDIVERLRWLAKEDPWQPRVEIAAQAADEIDRLRRIINTIHPQMQAHIDKLEAQVEQLREALQWFVDNDDTNEGDEPMPQYDGQTWNEINAYWIDGLNRARAALGEGMT